MNLPAKFWLVADKITTACPLCAFVRGFVLGSFIAVLVCLH